MILKISFIIILLFTTKVSAVDTPKPLKTKDFSLVGILGVSTTKPHSGVVVLRDNNNLKTFTLRQGDNIPSQTNTKIVKINENSVILKNNRGEKHSIEFSKFSKATNYDKTLTQTSNTDKQAEHINMNNLSKNLNMTKLFATSEEQNDNEEVEQNEKDDKFWYELIEELNSENEE